MTRLIIPTILTLSLVIAMTALVSTRSGSTDTLLAMQGSAASKALSDEGVTRFVF